MACIKTWGQAPDCSVANDASVLLLALVKIASKDNQVAIRLNSFGVSFVDKQFSRSNVNLLHSEFLSNVVHERT